MESERRNLKIIKNQIKKSKPKKSKKKINDIIVITIIPIIFLIFFLLFKSKKSKNINKIENNEYKKEKVNNSDMNEKIKLIRMFTNNNKYLYEKYEKCLGDDRDNLKCIYHFLAPKKVVGKERILIGEKKDGCYVLLNDFENIKIAYSFGIDNAIQFDEDLAKRNIEVYMYDHTINSLPFNNPKFHWKKIGICGNAERTAQLKTLEELLNENGHTSEMNMILKIDVEHAEWNALKDFPEEKLSQFKYIAIEYHFNKAQTESELYYDVLKKIHKTHQAFYHRCHGYQNVLIFGNNIICTYIEVSYVIRKDNKFTKDDTIYPYYEFDFSGSNNDISREINLNILKLYDL